MAKNALKVGDHAPQFTLLDASGEEVSLRDFKGRSVLIYFYPKANTPGCTVEACDFRDLRPKFLKKQVTILGVSADAPKMLAGFIAKQKLNFTLLSDPGHKMIEAYGAWRMKKFMGREFMGIVRSSYLVGPDGKIAQVWDHVRVKGHAAAVLEAAS
jgi:thioredoxin-dependent peroxiredoxin